MQIADCRHYWQQIGLGAYWIYSIGVECLKSRGKLHPEWLPSRSRSGYASVRPGSAVLAFRGTGKAPSPPEGGAGKDQREREGEKRREAVP